LTDDKMAALMEFGQGDIDDYSGHFGVIREIRASSTLRRMLVGNGRPSSKTSKLI
jgi:hypothetical protein